MASGGDARDLMGISATPSGPPPTKKVKGPPAPRVTGISREIQALQGDHAPPIPLNQIKYKSKPAYMNKAFKPRHYELRPFQNGARDDGLWLKHWKVKHPKSEAKIVKGPQSHAIAAETKSGEDTHMKDSGSTDGEEDVLGRSQDVVYRFDDEFPMEKFNIHVDIPTYTDDEYELLLKSEDWTKQETDYLMELCGDYDLRWFVVADRYDRTKIPLPPHIQSIETDGDLMDVDSTHASTPYHDRSLEELKARYYFVSHKMFERRIPPKEMNPHEYTNWDLAKKYDYATERNRKKLAEALFAREENEAMEEQLLLAELKKILKDEDDWLVSRNDLLGRIDFSLTERRRLPDDETHAFERSSIGLSQTLQHLLQKERALKQGTRRAIDGSIAPQSSTGGGATWEKGSHPNQYTRRNTQQSMDDVVQTPTAGPQKKGSMAAPQPVRQLTPAEEAKYGVTHHFERITSGVTFRGEKANRATVAKSQAQTQKIQGALAHLNVPLRLVMPTEKVVRTFESLVGEINLLLDVRKHAEKMSSEIQILESVRRRRLGEEVSGENGQLTVGTGTDGPAEDAGAERDEAMKDPAEEESSDAVAQPDSPQQQPKEPPDEEEAEENGDESVLKNMEDSKVEVVEDDEEERTSSREDSPDQNGQDDEDEANAEDGDDNDDVANDDENDDEEDIGAGLGVDNDDEDEDEEFQAEAEVEEESEAEAAIEADGEADDEDADAAAAEEDEKQEEEEEEADEADREGEEDGEDEDGEGDDDEQPNEEDAAEVEENQSENEVQKRKASAAGSVTSAAQKRSASVISEASRAGSNRSGIGRKKRR